MISPVKGIEFEKQALNIRPAIGILRKILGGLGTAGRAAGRAYGKYGRTLATQVPKRPNVRLDIPGTLKNLGGWFFEKKPMPASLGGKAWETAMRGMNAAIYAPQALEDLSEGRYLSALMNMAATGSSLRNPERGVMLGSGYNALANLARGNYLDALAHGVWAGGMVRPSGFPEVLGATPGMSRLAGRLGQSRALAAMEHPLAIGAMVVPYWLSGGGESGAVQPGYDQMPGGVNLIRAGGGQDVGQPMAAHGQYTTGAPTAGLMSMMQMGEGPRGVFVAPSPSQMAPGGELKNPAIPIPSQQREAVA